MGKFAFAKEERLSREIWIKELFEKGSSFNLYPFRIIFLDHPDQNYSSHQVLISVSIRNFKEAVDRNQLKRRIREAYRLNKQLMTSGSKLLIAYIYNGKEKETFARIESSVKKGFESILAKQESVKRKKDFSGK
jgi:ribonuclease P protein component